MPALQFCDRIDCIVLLSWIGNAYERQIQLGVQFYVLLTVTKFREITIYIKCIIVVVISQFDNKVSYGNYYFGIGYPTCNQRLFWEKESTVNYKLNQSNIMLLSRTHYTKNSIRSFNGSKLHFIAQFSWTNTYLCFVN